MGKTSVIIPTYKRKDSLLRLLATLLPQMDKSHELIIVEQGEKNKASYEALARAYKKTIRYVWSAVNSTPKAKNLGAKQAKGDYLVFYDDDVALKDHALKNIVRNFSDPTVGGVGGRVITPGNPDEPDRTDTGIVTGLGLSTDGFSSRIRQDIDTVIGCNMAWRAEVFKEVGGFDENFTGNALREESDLSLRVKKLGYRIIFDPTATVTHLREPHGGNRKADDRIRWYYHYFHNETYFFLKHRPGYLLPLFLLTKTSSILRCMFGFGREVSLRSLALPWQGIGEGVRSWKKTKPVVIGVDAGALSISDDRLKVGVWRVTYECLKSLSRIDRKNQYRLYSFTPIDVSIMKEFGNNAENVVLSPPFGYMKFRLPLELLLHPVDVFLGLSQALPRLSGKKIGFVYDLRFRHNVETESSGKLEAQTDDLVRRADNIIAISQFVKEDIIHAYHFPKNRITVAYPGVTKFRSDKPCAERKHPYFLFVGSLRKGKNIPELLEAFAVFLSRTGKPYDLVLAGGDKWYDKEIDDIIQKLTIKNSVHMTGYISDSELRCLYTHATAYVTTTKMEGFCLPIIEAFQNGCPVIAPRVGAIPEIVGNAGILYPSGNSTDLAQAMETMVMNKKMRMTYKKKGEERAKRYSWQKFAESILGIF